MLTVRCVVLLFVSFAFIGFVSSTEVLNPDVLIRLSSVEDKIVTVQEENEQLRLENKQLSRENKYLKADIRKLETHVKLHKKESEVIKDRLEKAEYEIAMLKSERLHDVPSPIAKTSSSDSSFSMNETSGSKEPLKTRPKNRNTGTSSKQKTFGQVLDPEGDLDHPKRLLLTPSTDSPIRERISFSAHMQTHATNLGNNQKLVFDVVNNNEGGGYDNLSGIFTCPTAGTYFFIVHILSYSSQEVAAAIVMNNVVKAMIDADGKAGGDAQGSSSLVIHCNKGDEVWIKHAWSHGNNVFGAKYSHFGGFILWAD